MSLRLTSRLAKKPKIQYSTDGRKRGPAYDRAMKNRKVERLRQRDQQSGVKICRCPLRGRAKVYVINIYIQCCFLKRK